MSSSINNQDELNQDDEKVVSLTNEESVESTNTDESSQNETSEENNANEVKDKAEPEGNTLTADTSKNDVVSSEQNAQQDDDDDDDDEAIKMIDEEESSNMDYSSYNKVQLLELAMDAPKSLSPREAVRRIQNIRPYFDDLIKEEREAQLNAFEENSTGDEVFEFIDDGSRNAFYQAFKNAQDARSEEKKRIEEEKLKNLEDKIKIIEEIKSLTETDETTGSLDEIKRLQNEWKSIRAVPKNNLQELYDRYHFYLSKFYDNLAINRELKELDRQKNIGIKIDLCNKVDALQHETSLKKAFILLAKYQEDFKNTGPVPKEYSEEIWERFKSTVDTVYSQKKAQFEQLQEKRLENLKLKELLIEKAKTINLVIPDKQSEWKQHHEALNALMEEWKKIGQVPKTHNESVWMTFREQFNQFYKNRSDQFKRLNAEKKQNKALKEELCVRAEAIKDNENLNETTKEFLKLQEEWKSIGPVPENESQKLWKRFRNACDHFFNKKHAHFDQRKTEEKENLILKNTLITKLNDLDSIEDGEQVFEKLKEIQQEWNKIGFVPLKSKQQVNEQYHQKLDEIYKKFRKNRETYKQAHMKEHYQQISDMPGGDKKLKDDERRIREKIKGLKSEIQTWENNMEFFANSKNADKFKKDILDKISKVNSQIENLQKELGIIRKAKTEK
ncbi:MAG: DUF349 domain-containing protein [Flavobacteriales bacterium]|nr:DUF349 domain-containing protein [Flavobacteriales bacterium]